MECGTTYMYIRFHWGGGGGGHLTPLTPISPPLGNVVIYMYIGGWSAWVVRVGIPLYAPFPDLKAGHADHLLTCMYMYLYMMRNFYGDFY